MEIIKYMLLLVGLAGYSYCLARLICYAYFREKLEFQKRFMAQIAPNVNKAW